VEPLDENHFCYLLQGNLASQFLFFVLLGCHVFFFLLHQMEEGKGEDEGGGTGVLALAMRESS